MVGFDPQTGGGAVKNLVWTERHAGRFIRIFRLHPALVPEREIQGEVSLAVYADAIEDIRRQVFARSDGDCEFCGATITWNTMHQHERISRGEGGEVSVANCVALCYQCHIGRKDSEHGDRRPRFGETSQDTTHG